MSLPPASSTLSVRAGRDAYLDDNGFRVDEYDARWAKVTIFGVTFFVPNTERRRRGIRLHDLHHLATGFGTDPVGEGEVSAWELAGGVDGLGLYLRGIITGGLLLGSLLAPRRVLRAWRAGRRGRPLWLDDTPYETLLAESVGELRRRVGVDPAGIARGRQGLHQRAPGPSPAGRETTGARSASLQAAGQAL